MKRIIVIVTFNGYQVLTNLLNDIKGFNIPNSEVCIVDNKSNDEEHLAFLKGLEADDYKVLYKSKGFELSAYKYALDNIEADVWFLLQDSIHIKQDIFSLITPLLTDSNVYSFLTFSPGLYDNHDDRAFLLLNYGTLQYSRANWPSCYFAKDSVLQKVKNEWKLPKNKIEAMAMERGTAIVFDRHNIEIKGLGVYDPPKSADPDAYPFFAKTYKGR